MGIKIPLRDLIGLMKDKASLLLSKPNASSSTLYPAVIRATSHWPHAPPDERHTSSLLLLGNGSRATASALITALMDRLHRSTGNCVVSLKCLIIIHHIINRGPFILQDQLSIFPSTGGYNYLKLSNFRDNANWILSSWVRWYARYLETLLSTSRVLGYFLGSSSCSMIKETQHDRISSYLNADLIKDIDSVVNVIEEICKAPDHSLLVEGNLLVKEIMGLLCNDHVSAVNEVLSRFVELKERLSCLSFSDSVELTCALKRLQDCRERLSVQYVMMNNNNNKSSVHDQSLWVLVQELRDGVGTVVHTKEESGRNRLLMSSDKVSESARYERGELRLCDPVEFQSGRLDGVNGFSSVWVVDESVELNLL